MPSKRIKNVGTTIVNDERNVSPRCYAKLDAEEYMAGFPFHLKWQLNNDCTSGNASGGRKLN